MNGQVPEIFNKQEIKIAAGAAKEGDMLNIKVKRGNEEVLLSAAAEKVARTQEHLLEFDNTATDEQLKVRDAWLNKKCMK